MTNPSQFSVVCSRPKKRKLGFYFLSDCCSWIQGQSVLWCHHLQHTAFMVPEKSKGSIGKPHKMHEPGSYYQLLPLTVLWPKVVSWPYLNTRELWIVVSGLGAFPQQQLYTLLYSPALHKSFVCLLCHIPYPVLVF